MKVKFFREARKISKRSSHHYYKLGAVIVKNGYVLGKGYNQPRKTHPLSCTYENTIHAELAAIISCKDKEELKDASIYIYREGGSGVPLLAKPCEHCQKLITDFGIRDVYFSINGSFSGYKNYGT
jgi:deoxycytidylate deaminase